MSEGMPVSGNDNGQTIFLGSEAGILTWVGHSVPSRPPCPTPNHPFHRKRKGNSVGVPTLSTQLVGPDSEVLLSENSESRKLILSFCTSAGLEREIAL